MVTSEIGAGHEKKAGDRRGKSAGDELMATPKRMRIYSLATENAASKVVEQEGERDSKNNREGDTDEAAKVNKFYQSSRLGGELKILRQERSAAHDEFIDMGISNTEDNRGNQPDGEEGAAREGREKEDDKIHQQSRVKEDQGALGDELPDAGCVVKKITVLQEPGQEEGAGENNDGF